MEIDEGLEIILQGMKEINKMLAEKGDIRAKTLVHKQNIAEEFDKISDFFENSIVNDDMKTIEKIHDYYAQIYLETENFIKELKGEKK